MSTRKHPPHGYTVSVNMPVPAWDDLPALSWKEKVCLLTYQSLQGPQVPLPLIHFFTPGNYIREMRIPAGTLLTGREHLLGHRMELVEGAVLVFAPDGRFRFDAPASMDTKPGFHAVVYAMTDVVARTVHPNPEESRDIEALENHWFGSPEAVIAQGREICQQLLAQPQP